MVTSNDDRGRLDCPAAIGPLQRNDSVEGHLMYQTGGNIKETLDAIQQSKFVLPAIQREFVWKPDAG